MAADLEQGRVRAHARAITRLRADAARVARLAADLQQARCDLDATITVALHCGVSVARAAEETRAAGPEAVAATGARAGLGKAA